MKKFGKALLALLVLLLLAAALFLYWPLTQRSVPAASNDKPVDVVLVGAGIMSITLATYLQELQPDWNIQVYERLDGVAGESSDGWNNAGTGHSAFAELNYTPELPDGSIETKRAVGIAESFEVSRQFWSHQVKEGRLSQPSDFINPTPHMSFVWGDDNIAYLHKRQQALVKNPLFYGMQYSEDPAQIKQWAPLLMEGRDPKQKVAATWMPLGTDVNFGVITRQLTAGLQRSPNFSLHLNHEVSALRQNADKSWNVTVKDLKAGTESTTHARFVFIGAGGAALKLLQMSDIVTEYDLLKKKMDLMNKDHEDTMAQLSEEKQELQGKITEITGKLEEQEHKLPRGGMAEGPHSPSQDVRHPGKRAFGNQGETDRFRDEFHNRRANRGLGDRAQRQERRRDRLADQDRTGAAE